MTSNDSELSLVERAEDDKKEEYLIPDQQTLDVRPTSVGNIQNETERDSIYMNIIIYIVGIATIFGLGNVTATMIHYLNNMDSKTKRGSVVISGIALIGLYLMIGYGAQFLCNFIGFVYPAYCSIKAIESTNKEDDTQWLTYWVVYSCFHLVEFFSDIFLFWIPFYWFFKCCFLVWCFSSVPWNGSAFLYTKFIRPFILRHQDKIDSALDKAKGAAMEASDMAKEIASDEVIRRAAASVTKED